MRLKLLRILQAEQLDYTQSFIRLQNKEYKALRDDCLDIRQFDAFLTQYQNIREYQDIDELDANMQQVNPIYILRNHMAQRAIEAAERDDLVRLTAYLSYSTIPIQSNQIWKTGRFRSVTKRCT